MNVKQIRKDFDNGVIISKATYDKLIDYALKQSAAPVSAIHECTNCLGTGKSNKGLSNYLDCAEPGCNATQERAALEADFGAAANEWPESLWQAYQLGKRCGREGK